MQSSLSYLGWSSFLCCDNSNCFAQVNHSPAHRSGFLESIWNSCLSLFSLGRPERLDAYDILSLYFSVLKSGHQGAIPGADEVQNFDLRNVTEFWDELRRGLVSRLVNYFAICTKIWIYAVKFHMGGNTLDFPYTPG